MRCLTLALLPVLGTSSLAAAQSSSPWRFVELTAPSGTWAVSTAVDRFRNAYGYAFPLIGLQLPRAVRWRAANAWAPEVLEDRAAVAGSNPDGFAVGHREAETWPNSHPLFWDQGGTASVLTGMPSYTSANASGINTSGAICGTFTADAGPRAFWWFKGDGIEIPQLPGYVNSVARAINNASFVVGYAHDDSTPPAVSASWIWTKTGGTQELTRPSSFSEPTDINNTGLISGWYRLSGYAKPIVWPIFGRAQELASFPGFDNASANAVADGGLVVGTAWVGKWNKRSSDRAVAWDGAQKYELTSLFNQGGSWTLLAANDVNARGDIVGVGTFNGRGSGFLLLRKP